MRVNVSELLADRNAERVLSFSESLDPPADDVWLPDPVTGEIVLQGTGRSVLLRGRVRTVAELVCGGCLRPFRTPLVIEVDEEFTPPRTEPAPAEGTGGKGGGERALDPDDFGAPLEPGGMLDVTEVVRQHLVLAVPFAPRCREDCRGLCSVCGADRNTAPCACEPHEPDPRMTVLRRWTAGPHGGT